MKRFLYKHIILTLISSVLFLIIFYLTLRITEEGTTLTPIQYYLFIYMYILLGYLTVGFILSFITDKFGNRFKFNKFSLIIIKLIIYLLIPYAIFHSLFVLIAPLIYLLFETLIYIIRR